ncbi:MAG: hypothetical protein Roseis2KO_41740 [Roseivirga sp.]
MSSARDQNKRGPVYHFFWWAAGADRDLMLQCPKSEHEKVLSIGITVCLTAVLAGISGYFAISTIVDMSSYAIMIAAFWGFVIFNLDRFIVMSIRKDREGRTWKEVVSALPRIVLAILIAFVVSKPIEMELFATQIQFAQKELIQQKDTTDVEERFREFGIGEKRSELDGAIAQSTFLDSLSKLPEPDLQAYRDKKVEVAAARAIRDRLNAEHRQKKTDRQAKFRQIPFVDVPIYENDSIVGYNSVRDDKTDEWYAWYQLWLETRETPGKEGTLTVERNAQRREVTRLVGQLNKIRTDYYDDINSRLTQADSNRQEVAAEKDSVESVFQEKVTEDMSINQQYYQGMFAKLEAFNFLVSTEKEKGNMTPFWSQWLILMLFFVLETAPIISKILSKRGPYDELLDNQHSGYNNASDIALRARTGEAVRESMRSEQQLNYLHEQQTRMINAFSDGSKDFFERMSSARNQMNESLLNITEKLGAGYVDVISEQLKKDFERFKYDFTKEQDKKWKREQNRTTSSENPDVRETSAMDSNKSTFQHTEGQSQDRGAVVEEPSPSETFTERSVPDSPEPVVPTNSTSNTEEDPGDVPPVQSISSDEEGRRGKEQSSNNEVNGGEEQTISNSGSTLQSEGTEENPEPNSKGIPTRKSFDLKTFYSSVLRKFGWGKKSNKSPKSTD